MTLNCIHGNVCDFTAILKPSNHYGSIWERVLSSHDWAKTSPENFQTPFYRVKIQERDLIILPAFALISASSFQERQKCVVYWCFSPSSVTAP